MYNSSNVTDRRNSSNVKRIQNMNSHFKSKNYKEGSKSQQNQAFLMTTDSEIMRYRIENRYLICF